MTLALACGPSSAEASGGPAAERLFDVGGYPVTNSMVSSWVISVFIIVVVRLAVRQPRLIPTRGQAVVESIVEGIRNVVSPIVGPQVIHAAFPLLIGLFSFILIQNWSGLFPGVGTIFVRFQEGDWVPFVRPAHADMNGTLALALVAIGMWLYLILRFAGPKAVFLDIFGNKADKRENPAAIYYPLFVVFAFVGVIEVVSIIFRPISLSVRLFGNVFGGENLLAAMAGISNWLVPIPFYFLELLIGFVQAFVFTLLVSVYIGLICNHGEGHDQEAHAPGSGSADPVAH